MTASTTLVPSATRVHLTALRDLSLAAARTGAEFTAPVAGTAQLRAVLAALPSPTPCEVHHVTAAVGPWLDHADTATVHYHPGDGLTITALLAPPEPGTVVDRVMVATALVRVGHDHGADAIDYRDGGLWTPAAPLPLHSVGPGVATGVRLHWNAVGS